jgi:hypothetical protein
LSSAIEPSGWGRRGRPHPDADTLFPALALDVHAGERLDNHAFESSDEGPDVLLAPLQVEHDVDDALSRPVIGVFAAAARLVHRKSVGHDEVRCIGAGAGGIERRMFDEPYEFVRFAGRDCRCFALHRFHSLGIIDERRRDSPAHRR